MRKTKIICTLGPSTDDENVLKEMIKSGMNIARFNFSHQDQQNHKIRFDRLVKLREELNVPVATLLDTKGPEIRTRKFKDGKVLLKANEKFTLTTDDIIGDESIASITYQDLSKDVKEGTRILIDDGLIELKVESIENNNIHCKIINGGPVSDNKSINIPGIKLSLPYVSEKDKKDIIFAAEAGFDFIAASFTRSAEDIMEIKKILYQNNGQHIKIIAKIENAEGVENADEILKVSDGLMIARGDMGVEIPFEKLPAIQKVLIKKAYNAGKQVITATQMLESMIKNPRPTRAETTDVANAIYDGTSAIMLSGETAAGAYPVETLKIMDKIAISTEEHIDYVKRFKNRDFEENVSITNAISHATVTTAHDLKAKAIITVTKSGKTARMISKYRPSCPIISCSSDSVVCRQLNMAWGVTPILIEQMQNTDLLFEKSIKKSIKSGLIDYGDLVVITAGVPIGVSGTTNLLKVCVSGNILIKGNPSNGEKITGKLFVQEEDMQNIISDFEDGSILVIKDTNDQIKHVLEKCSAVIVEEKEENSHAVKVCKDLNIPVISEAKNATKILRHDSEVIIYPEMGSVCTK